MHHLCFGVSMMELLGRGHPYIVIVGSVAVVFAIFFFFAYVLSRRD